jgi:UDP-N-acetylmuramate dehydrogenase
MSNRVGDVDVAELAAAMRRVVSGRLGTAEPLAPLTSLRVGGPAAVYVEPAGEDDLLRVAETLAGLIDRTRRGSGVPVLVLGRGTNLLVSDEGFPGVVIRLTAGFEWIAGGAHNGRCVEAGGGAPLPRVANYAARRSLAGMEFAVAIPATVGGGIRMNAGAHGASIASVLAWARVLSLTTGLKQTLKAESLHLAYRSSSLAETDIVCAARFELVNGDRQEITRLMDAYRLHRSTTQPAEAPNAGSMFRNPEGASAGSLIESARLKGLKMGNVEVSERHANFFLARPGATAQQVHDLMVAVQQAVEEQAGILLQPEVHIVGAFAGSDRLRRGPS